jgi:hypothetical protein
MRKKHQHIFTLLGNLKSFFVKIKISPGWLRQNILFFKSKMPRKNPNKLFVSEVFIKKGIFCMLLMIIYV